MEIMANRFQKCVLLMLPYTVSAAIAVHGVFGGFMLIPVRLNHDS
jgi:hypothetical protein